MFEVKASQQVLVALGAGSTPIEAPCDHQVNHQEEIIVEGQDKPFAESASAGCSHTLEHVDRRVVGLEHRDAFDSDLFDRPSYDVSVERFEVDDNVGILRHA